MEKEQSREFTGVWIPRAVVEDERLTWTDRALYAEIACYKLCWASNAFLAKRIGVSESMVSKIIARLKSLKYVDDAGFNGRFRQLIARQPSNVLLGSLATDCEAASQCIARIDNSIENNKEKSIVSCEAVASRVHDPLGSEIIKAFTGFNNAARSFYGNKTQRQACDLLLESYGLERTMNAIEWVKAHRGREFVPVITTPLQLWQKWAQLETAAHRNGRAKSGIAYL